MAKTANEQLLDALIRHQTYLLRYSGGLRNRMLSILASSEEEISLRILGKLSGLKGYSTPASMTKATQLIKDIEQMRGLVWSDASQLLLSEMGDLAQKEALTMQNILQTVAPVVLQLNLPPERQLRAIVNSNPFEGALLKDWAEGLKSEDLRRIRAAIQVGMFAGEGSDQIARRVIGTSALNGNDGALQYTRRQVEAISRTAVQHIANSARDDFMEENSDIILAELFVATLDSKTTLTCRANDGKTYPVGKGPRPPLHIACRSLRVAAFNGEALGSRPYKASTKQQLLRDYTEEKGLPKVGSRDDLPRGQKGSYDDWARKKVREMTGQVPRGTTYQEWLKKQTRSFQEDTLGITKAKLFREGGLKLDKFVAADGTELTLAQLAKRHASAFRAAGLDPVAWRV